MKKTLFVILMGVFSLTLFSGCCREHQWTDATCDAPRTCSECGKTEGEKLEHQWTDVTCSAPKTCKLCGTTEGEALPHTEGTPANYQSGPICSVCGQEMGEKLPADFESEAIPGQFMELGVPVSYVTGCYSDPTMVTIGKATVTEYERFDSNEDFEAFDGYEWIKMSFEILFDDDNAQQFGYMVGPAECSYYDIKNFDDSCTYDEDTGVSTYTVNFNGQDFSECHDVWGDWTTEGWQDDGDGTYSLITACTNYTLVPKGYDGIVYGLYNRQITWNEGMYINDVANDDTLFFRCN